MVYQNLPNNVIVLQYAPWYKLEHLADTLNSIRNINFSIVEQRQQALETYNKTISTSPFSSVHRFSDGLYVCAVYGDWPRKFSQMVTALSYKSSSKDEKMKPDSKTETAGADFNDAHVAFRNATISMWDQLYKLEGVFDRNTFESKFSVAWND